MVLLLGTLLFCKGTSRYRWAELGPLVGKETGETRQAQAHHEGLFEESG